MKVKHLRHIPLFEHVGKDQDEEDVNELDNLPYFELVVKLAALKEASIPNPLHEGCCWTELDLALSTCAYLGTDYVAKKLVAQALWNKPKAQLEPILDFHTATWQKEAPAFLTNYLNLYFKLHKDEFGRIDTRTRVDHCWTDKEICNETITTTDAAQFGNLNTLVLLHEKGCAWDAYTCYGAALNGHLPCLTYAHENGARWYADTCRAAAENGHLPCLTYAHENGCPWDVDTCYWAAANGQLPCLTYAHENGCPWNVVTCRAAAANGQLACLTYAREHGCPTCNKIK